MKITYITIVLSLFISVKLMSQEVKFDGKASLVVPSKSRKITKAERNQKMEEFFGDAGKLKDFPAENEYLIDDKLLLTLFFGTLNGNKNLLIDQKKSADNRKAKLDLNESHHSEIVKINDYDVLITTGSISNADGYCSFGIINRNYTLSISGRLTFKAADQKLAESILAMLLKSVKFNN